MDDHATRACRAVLHMRQMMAELNACDAFGFQSGHKPIQQARIGVGINTGLRRQHGLRPPLQLFGGGRCGERRCAHLIELQGGRRRSADLRRHTAAAVPGFALLEAGEIPLKGKSEPVRPLSR
ncbi:hypothetical protein [Breoghania sp.]|uniref:hypothetical protein n=1 Tax=Breoghania sp. TaxID=2065378 RepID=UPI0026209523|nr:hypothetical protein [Breoghania sp.]MDJ0931929.1 hypothetical protein [Breoghania sp.]